MLNQPTDALLRHLFEDASELPISFEVFPPRSAEGRACLEVAVENLADAATGGFSVTMGAGGSNRSGTHETAVDIARISGRPVTAHLTALGLSREQVLKTADDLWSDGIKRILALRGDRPRGLQGPLPQSFPHASELVRALRQRHDFDIAVAAYPEKHPQAETLASDIDHLKEKLDAGASRAICQFVLNPEIYGRFLEACDRHGISAPIVPGVMLLENWQRVWNFALSVGASVPEWLKQLLAEQEKDAEVGRLIAMATTTEQVRRLIAYGAPALHIYTLNHWEMPLALAQLLGHRFQRRFSTAAG